MIAMRRAMVCAGLCVAMGAVPGCGRAHDARAARSDEGTVTLSGGRVPLTGDSLAARADSLVRAGRPWRATVLLAPQLRVPASASPELRLAGARAAAGWEGWFEVERLLRDAPWLDAQFGGEGRELLARGALSRGQEAVMDARRALDAATTEEARVARRVLLARAYDRANARDSAAAAYSAAARRLAPAADWLRLRAAGVTADSAARARSYADVASVAARARIPYTDAQARERTGDYVGAARVFRSAGAEGSAFRVEALAARDDAGRAMLASRIATYLGTSRNPAEARQALDVLDRLAPRLTQDEELTVARAAAQFGTPARGVVGFERAQAAGPLAPRDRFDYAGALLRAGRALDAARQFANLASDSTLGAMAAYQRARAQLLAGDGGGARAALRAVATERSAAPEAAAALLLLADLQVDDGDVTGAGRTLAELVQRHPGTPQAPLGRFRLGLIQWTSDPRLALATFDTLARRHPNDAEAIPARYWAARAADRLGQHDEAARRWREVIATAPMSYYAGLSARRLRTAGWTPPAGPDTAAHVPAIDSAAARIAMLQQLDMDVEARFELDALADRAERVPADAAPIAAALLAAGEPSRALRAALHAMEQGTPTRALVRSAYPIVHGDALSEEARRNALDPALVAGLIRQESSFNPRAVSPAGARGLMQLMPSVGASIAAAKRYPLWNPALLFDPDVSLELGTTHLASSLRQGVPWARALAAYNAGASRVARWIQRPGSDDPELFAEWIPFAETRDYVRIVQRNAEVYRALYGLR
jgi:soluble lytic murein transglycosylase